jgi:hypothetical protein
MAHADIIKGGPPAHSNIIRQWSELAYWFPSVTNAAGQQSVRSVPSIGFTDYDPPSASLTNTHSYLKLQPYPSVFPAWKQIKGFMQ